MMRTALIAMDKIDMAREARASIRVRLHSFCSASFSCRSISCRRSSVLSGIALFTSLASFLAGYFVSQRVFTTPYAHIIAPALHFVNIFLLKNVYFLHFWMYNGFKIGGENK